MTESYELAIIFRTEKITAGFNPERGFLFCLVSLCGDLVLSSEKKGAACRTLWPWASMTSVDMKANMQGRLLRWGLLCCQTETSQFCASCALYWQQMNVEKQDAKFSVFRMLKNVRNVRHTHLRP